MDRRITIIRPNWSVWSGLGFAVYAAASVRSLPGGLELLSLFGSFALGLYFHTDRFWRTYVTALTLAIPLGLLGYHFEYLNGNYLGCLFALGAAAAFEAALPYQALALSGATVFSHSRGALCGVFWAILCSCSGWRRIALCAGVCGAAALVWWMKIGTPGAILERLGVWQDTINNTTLLGHGWGSFFDSYMSWPRHTNTGFGRMLHAYNDFLELVYDLGLGALLLWPFLFSLRPSLFVSVFIILSMTFFPLHLIPLGQLLAFKLGQLTNETHL